jgi:hypothetical protein
MRIRWILITVVVGVLAVSSGGCGGEPGLAASFDYVVPGGGATIGDLPSRIQRRLGESRCRVLPECIDEVCATQLHRVRV